jgi:hypothetical protein
MHGYPDTVKFPVKDKGYDPFTGQCWKPRKRPIAWCRITTWHAKAWRKLQKVYVNERFGLVSDIFWRIKT